MTLFTLWKTNKEDDSVTLLGQSTDEDFLKQTARNLNDNDKFVVKNNGATIVGNNSIFDVFDKNDVKSVFEITHKLDEDE